MIPNTNSEFLSYELSPEEELSAYNYSQLQLIGMQNLLADYASELMSLHTLDSTEEGRLKLAMTMGQISVLKYLLERGKNAAALYAAQAKLNEDNSQED